MIKEVINFRYAIKEVINLRYVINEVINVRYVIKEVINFEVINFGSLSNVLEFKDHPFS